LLAFVATSVDCREAITVYMPPGYREGIHDVMNKSFAAVNTATIASKMTIAAVNYGLWWVD